VSGFESKDRAALDSCSHGLISHKQIITPVGNCRDSAKPTDNIARPDMYNADNIEPADLGRLSKNN